MPEILRVPPPPVQQPRPTSVPRGPGSAHTAQRTAGARAVPRLDARIRIAEKQNLSQGPEKGEGKEGARAAGAGAPAGVRSVLGESREPRPPAPGREPVSFPSPAAGPL